jgi:CRISPR-associated exonuclease Cas4
VTFSEDELLPLSGLQHLVFCERQWALIHLEQVWADNTLTVRGAHAHRRVHEGNPRRELRGRDLIVRRLALRSLRLGVSGIADVVEFRRVADTPEGPRTALPLAGLAGRWAPYPVEYKRGRPKANRCDEVQLCAQAMCLEEMLDVAIPEGALFYGATQRRLTVGFGKESREFVEVSARRLHDLFQTAVTPAAKHEPKCRSCSLLGRCRPDALRARGPGARYLRDAVAASLAEAGGPL